MYIALKGLKKVKKYSRRRINIITVDEYRDQVYHEHMNKHSYVHDFFVFSDERENRGRKYFRVKSGSMRKQKKYDLG